MIFTDYIWDLGGTLLDNYETSAAAFQEVLASFGVSVSHDAIYEALRTSTDFAISEFAAGLPDFAAAYKKTEAKALTHPVLFKDAAKVLATICQNGQRNFMISHRNDQVLEILETAGISSYFKEVVTASNGFARKPSPESINYLLDKYQMAKPVMIGDRAIDVVAGENAGIATIYFDDNATQDSQEIMTATYTVSNLSEILTLKED
ncbi:HAD-IA family hydrolase [Pseudolactococcus insecticola]|uniref:Hydrolase n=1 Tax=Pseudolactococcus insecticola TaxID=2709158 RepID=A0A6A0B7J3_9LACT|nr:HAD-IA family hydrolase [Lactococcus insecticola]GFH40314.1 hydrolase [Lactococcus insecticola]